MVGNLLAAFCGSPIAFIYGAWYLYEASHMISDDEREKLLVLLLIVFSPLLPFLLINVAYANLGTGIIGVYLFALICIFLILLKTEIFPAFFVDKLIFSFILLIPSAIIFILFIPRYLMRFGIAEY
ncbi:MAG: hypothetical protein J0M11_14035 [Anaerolineae bacterium]|nr:hypothetical protein [Anaerolineae bacterium]